MTRDCAQRGRQLLIASHSDTEHYGFEDEEPEYDPEEPIEPQGSGDEDGGDGAGGADDDILNEDQERQGGSRVIDPKTAGKSKSKEAKSKKVPNEQRNTTPYMTKYERARILGTRALQIRCVGREVEGYSLWQS